MRPGQNRRMRGRNRNNGGGNNKGPNPLTRSYESNGPDVKVRGNAQTIAEKYMQLARDAMASGDPVGAENYYQHAEHYVRIVLAAHEQLRQQYGEHYRPQRPFGLQDQEDDADEADDATEAAVQPARRGDGEQPDIAGDDDDVLIADEIPARPVREGSESRQRVSDPRNEGRHQDGRRFERDRQGGDRPGDSERFNGERRFDRDRNERHMRGERRFDRPRDGVRRDDTTAPAATDEVGVLPAFLMTPARTVAPEAARADSTRLEPVRAEPLTEAAPAAAEPAVPDAQPAAPAPKRRGRPPRKRDEGVAEIPGE